MHLVKLAFVVFLLFLPVNGFSESGKRRTAFSPTDAPLSSNVGRSRLFFYQRRQCFEEHSVALRLEIPEECLGSKVTCLRASSRFEDVSFHSDNVINKNQSAAVEASRVPLRPKRDRMIRDPIKNAVTKFRSKPLSYCLIPCIAAVVGWVTNYMAVQMIFYPIRYRGLNIFRKDEVPLGLLGWQGIVPCKTRTMSEAMVRMVTTQLINVPNVFKRLDPRRMADLLAPEVPKIAQEVLDDVAPSWVSRLPKAIFAGLPTKSKEILAHFNRKFLVDFARDLQFNIEKVLSIRNCVVDQMLMDRAKLGQLFQKCGSKELDFLTNSGLWFGFMLGVIQMIVALFWDNPWSLSIGGLIVGYATNWLALKWIFEPVNPTKVGPFILQGQFLRRQKEVAAEFSTFFANNILTSERVWHSILTDRETSPGFNDMFTNHITRFATSVTGRLQIQPEPQVIGMAASRALDKLPAHVAVLHSYIDKTLDLRTTLRVQMEKMTSEEFERVLHPIFEEDELTLILAGAALGFVAGLIQQGLETGKIKLPNAKDVRNSFHVFSDRVTAMVKKRLNRFSKEALRAKSRINAYAGSFLDRLNGHRGSS